jgi:pyridoxine/pyridoxamine 5'-phosphate oxidase
LILNLTGQVRVISQTKNIQSHHYAQQAPDVYDKYKHDLGTYWQDLQKQTLLNNHIVHSLDARQIDSDLSGRPGHREILSTWIDQSCQLMSQTTTFFKGFKTELDKKIGENLKDPS